MVNNEELEKLKALAEAADPPRAGTPAGQDHRTGTFLPRRLSGKK